jgi:hypothetical protein
VVEDDLKIFRAHELEHHVVAEQRAKTDPAFRLVPRLRRIVINIPGHKIVETVACRVTTNFFLATVYSLDRTTRQVHR